MSSKIEWTEHTWNPMVGCSKCSRGCKNCYAIDEAWIRKHHPNPKIKQKFDGVVHKTEGGVLNWTGNIHFAPDALQIPLRRKKATLYFVNSMSDTFHPNMPVEYIDEIHAVMALCRQHTFQLLTKHPDEMAAYYRGNWQQRVIQKLHEVYRDESKKLFDMCGDAEARLQVNDYLQNIWHGTTVEDQLCANERIPHLMQVPTACRWLSCEPLVSSIKIYDLVVDMRTNTPMVDWIVVGGEQAVEAQPMHPAWVMEIRNLCERTGIPFFFKQWGDWVPIEHWGDSAVRTKRYVWEDGSVEEDMYVKNGRGGQVMAKVGKKRAGAVLEFREHRDYPKIWTDKMQGVCG